MALLDGRMYAMLQKYICSISLTHHNKVLLGQECY